MKHNSGSFMVTQQNRYADNIYQNSLSNIRTRIHVLADSSKASFGKDTSSTFVSVSSNSTNLNLNSKIYNLSISCNDLIQ